MRVAIMPVRPTTDEGVDGYDYAVIDLYAAAGTIWDLQADAKAIHERINRYVEVSIFNYNMYVIPDYVLRATITNQKVMSELDDNGGGVFRVPVHQVNGMRQDSVRTECDQLHVSINEFWWEFFPKFSGLTYYMDRLDISKLGDPAERGKLADS